LAAKYTHEHKYFLNYVKHFTVNRHVSPSDNSDKSQQSTSRNQVARARAFNVLTFFTGWNRSSVTSTNEQKCTEVAYKLRLPTT
jgi:hypothetical protein